MRAEEFIDERKKRKQKRSKRRAALWGPGPYGLYGVNTGYSGVSDGGGAVGGGDGGSAESIKREASYPGNIGMMEVFKFMQKAQPKEIVLLKNLIDKKEFPTAWKMIQDVVGEKLQGKEFQTDEGWKDTLANLGIAGAMSLGAAGGMVAKQALSNPTGIEQPSNKVSGKVVDAPNKEIKIAANAVPKKSVTGSPHEKLLTKAAIAAGIKGEELAQFLAQTAHETGNFEHMVEIGGSLDFRKYDPKYAPKKARALGNKKVGDGARYKGRGYIQLTGRYNYKRAGEALGLPLEAKPELVEKPEVAAKVAIWFWQNRVQPKVDDFGNTPAATKPINSGLKGLQDRKDKFQDFKVSMK
jgi:predicted chitinase